MCFIAGRIKYNYEYELYHEGDSAIDLIKYV